MDQTPRDGRGAHWREKIDAGQGPMPWSFTALWAVRLADLEKKLAEQLEQHGLQTYTLPWRRIGGYIYIGNSCKALFTQLLIHHLNKVVCIEFSDGGVSRLGEGCSMDFVDSFLGIMRVVILKPDSFNAVESGIHTIAWVKINLPSTKTKTLIKLWHTVGMFEVRGSSPLVYLFNTVLRRKHLELTGRAYSKKRSAAEVSNPSKKQCAAELDAVEVLSAMACTAGGVPAAMPTEGVSGGVPAAMTTESVSDGVPAPTVIPAVAAAFQRAETLERRAAVAEIRASAAELHAVATELHADAIELQVRVNAMHAEANRLDQRSAAMRAEAVRLEQAGWM